MRDGRGAGVRLLVQREPLRYDEIILKSELPAASPLKLRDFEFVERMGDCHRLPPCPSPASALATIMYRWRLDDEPIGCRISQARSGRDLGEI